MLLKCDSNVYDIACKLIIWWRLRERPGEIQVRQHPLSQKAAFTVPLVKYIVKKKKKEQKKPFVLGLGSFIILSQKYVTLDLEDVIIKYVIKLPCHKESLQWITPHVLFGRCNIKGICISSLSLESCNK